MDGGCDHEFIKGHCLPIDPSATRCGLQLFSEAEAVVGECDPAPHERLVVDEPSSAKRNITPLDGVPMAVFSSIPLPAVHLIDPYFPKERRKDVLPGCLLWLTSG